MEEEVVWNESAQQVRRWLCAKVQSEGEKGVLAAKIPGLWTLDHPDTGTLPLKLQKLGFQKLSKFLHACKDIVELKRPVAPNGRVSTTELRIFALQGDGGGIRGSTGGGRRLEYKGDRDNGPQAGDKTDVSDANDVANALECPSTPTSAKKEESKEENFLSKYRRRKAEKHLKHSGSEQEQQVAEEEGDVGNFDGASQQTREQQHTAAELEQQVATLKQHHHFEVELLTKHLQDLNTTLSACDLAKSDLDLEIDALKTQLVASQTCEKMLREMVEMMESEAMQEREKEMVKERERAVERVRETEELVAALERERERECERDVARRQKERLEVEKEELERARCVIMEEKMMVEIDRDEARSERESGVSERDSVLRERDSAVTDKALVEGEREVADKERAEALVLVAQLRERLESFEEIEKERQRALQVFIYVYLCICMVYVCMYVSLRVCCMYVQMNQ
jgi:hypothetical protein